MALNKERMVIVLFHALLAAQDAVKDGVMDTPECYFNDDWEATLVHTDARMLGDKQAARALYICAFLAHIETTKTQFTRSEPRTKAVILYNGEQDVWELWVDGEDLPRASERWVRQLLKYGFRFDVIEIYTGTGGEKPEFVNSDFQACDKYGNTEVTPDAEFAGLVTPEMNLLDILKALTVLVLALNVGIWIQDTKRFAEEHKTQERLK